MSFFLDPPIVMQVAVSREFEPFRAKFNIERPPAKILNTLSFFFSFNLVQGDHVFVFVDGIIQIVEQAFPLSGTRRIATSSPLQRRHKASTPLGYSIAGKLLTLGCCYLATSATN